MRDGSEKCHQRNQSLLSCMRHVGIKRRREHGIERLRHAAANQKPGISATPRRAGVQLAA